ncbi:MAG TPA: hypothetical protein DCM54_04320 [Gammaproteobacteria bacterium]|nr:hypothetical protein [Gammaproteobacteria bacterium]|tara:strand:+ start:987 stop:1472 length:486 start_codon:yes stop_codon:yes gene_type:complete
MRIGIVSDTHNNLENCRQIVDLFNEARVESVIHTGDITQSKTIDVFSELQMPMVGVFGNNDVERESLNVAMDRHGFSFIDPPLTLEWFSRRLVVVHDPLQLQELDTAEYDVVIHGHTHRQIIEYRGEKLTFNPGECAGIMKGFNAIGILDLNDLSPQILTF